MVRSAVVAKVGPSARLIALTLAGLLALAGVSAAETRARPLPSDPRIKQYTYERDTVYRLDLYMRFITALQFGDGENIESVQVGDSESWQIIRLARGDVLSVKPLIEGAYTNMTVYTDRRVYTFELRARSERVGSPNLNYRINFRYADEERAKQAAARERQNRPRNADYYVAGRAAFRPLSVYDDGKATYFRFPGNAPRPAIFRADADGRESIVNVRQTDDGAVIDSTSDRWTIRIGDDEICVANGSVLKSVPGGRKATRANLGVDLP